MTDEKKRNWALVSSFIGNTIALCALIATCVFTSNSLELTRRSVAVSEANYAEATRERIASDLNRRQEKEPILSIQDYSPSMKFTLTGMEKYPDLKAQVGGKLVNVGKVPAKNIKLTWTVTDASYDTRDNQPIPPGKDGKSTYGVSTWETVKPYTLMPGETASFNEFPHLSPRVLPIITRLTYIGELHIDFESLDGRRMSTMKYFSLYMAFRNKTDGWLQLHIGDNRISREDAGFKAQLTDAERRLEEIQANLRPK